MFGIFKFFAGLRSQHLAYKAAVREAELIHAESRAEVARYSAQGRAAECLRQNMALFGHSNVRLGDAKMTHYQGRKLVV